MKSIYSIILFSVIVFWSFTSISKEAEHHHKEHSPHDEHHHKHHAPHDGTLVVLGEEFAHMEFVLDSETGILTVYVLDGEVEKPIRIEQEKIDLQIITMSNKKPETSELILMAVSNVLTGEKIGDSSEFSTQSDKLINQNSFKVVVSGIKVKGVEFKAVEFSFPEGNE